MIGACLVTMIHAWFAKGATMLNHPLSFYGIALSLGIFCTFLPSYMISYGIKKQGLIKPLSLLAWDQPLPSLLLTSLWVKSSDG